MRHLHKRRSSDSSKQDTCAAAGVNGYGTKRSVLARLQHWFPVGRRAPSVTTSSTSNPPTLPRLSLADKPKEPQFLKVRLMTWNMHDSLPKGNLEELLGHVDPYVDHLNAPTSLPQFEPEGSHPYHLVVFAGQECPTQSGMPKGLGAGFKIIDKDRDKDKDSHENHDKPHKPRRHMSEEISDPYLAGWTAMMEDWFCHGGCQTVGVPSPNGTNTDTSAQSPKKSFQVIREKKGPYQLLVKERMMGIYLAVFIHRDIRHLVQGTSKSAVTAGLIGGRLGNKGGVGISINLDGTTFLFLNAHLAAHEGRIHHRLANFAKIKAELTVDHFLTSDDPRMMAEDLTDKFDHTFVCGDLNFRLDISRLHADWLISRQEYAQALAFDQLANIMRNGQAFVGFREAPIAFPPTFKYDVMRTLKKSKRHRTKGKAHRSLSEVEEREKELESSSDEEDGDEAEMISIESSTHPPSRSQETGSDHFLFHSNRQDRDAMPASSRVSLSASIAAAKAKNKWRKFMNGSPITPTSPAARNLHRAHSNKEIFLSPADSLGTKQDLVERVSIDSTRPSSKRRGSTDLVKHAHSAKSGKSPFSDSEDENEGSDHGVYDSSSKQRVPSWCDRILWKTTVKPDPDPEPTGTQPRAKNRTSIGQIIFGAFYKPHRGSISSTLSGDTATNHVRSESPEPLPASTSNPSSVPFSRFHTVSAGVTSETNSSQLRSSKSYDDAIPPRRSNSSSSFSVNRPGRRKHTTLPPISTNITKNTPTAQPNDINSHSAQENSNAGESTPLLSFPWRFLSFMSKSDKEPAVHAARTEDSEIIAPPPKPLHKKGDVVCLNYDTLDDRRMRRLEGRSDHRPVIGSYAIYL